jgi:outer membrane lipoprotein-sorting protein
MTLTRDPNHGHCVVWLDRNTNRVVGWERITTAGERKIRYMFRQPEQSPDGVWYSRRIELYTPEDHLVGALRFTDVRLNQGLNSALFR